MSKVQETTRKPNYPVDLKYGKIGEKDFENHFEKCNKNGYSIFDVREFKEYQKIDIDYVIDIKGEKQLPPVEDVLKEDRYIKIEVKLDSRANDTGNIPYEMISHSSSGWCVTTKSDYVYIVLVEKDGVNIIKRGWINMKRWHEFCANRNCNKKISYIVSENGIVDLLCKMSDLENNGVLKWIN